MFVLHISSITVYNIERKNATFCLTNLREYFILSKIALGVLSNEKAEIESVTFRPFEPVRQYLRREAVIIVMVFLHN